eukprot:COSAG04_NODE_9813_length_830_cov_1.240766_1_plen_187_part_00
MLDRDAGIGALLTMTPGQSVSVIGDPSFAPVPNGPWSSHPEYNTRDAPLWGAGSFAVHERGSLALTRIALDPAATITVSDGGSLSLASMIVSEAALTTAYGVASTLRLADVAVAEYRSAAGAQLGSSDCPVGAALAVGDALSWTSDGAYQGSVAGLPDNGCAAKSTCGLPYSNQGLGGGWQLCFVQ